MPLGSAGEKGTRCATTPSPRLPHGLIEPVTEANRRDIKHTAGNGRRSSPHSGVSSHPAPRDHLLSSRWLSQLAKPGATRLPQRVPPTLSHPENPAHALFAYLPSRKTKDQRKADQQQDSAAKRRVFRVPMAQPSPVGSGPGRFVEVPMAQPSPVGSGPGRFVEVRGLVPPGKYSGPP